MGCPYVGSSKHSLGFLLDGPVILLVNWPVRSYLSADKCSLF